MLKSLWGLVGEYSQTTDKSLAGTLMSTLTTTKFDGSCTMHEHVIEMTNIAARLKTLGMVVNENFLVQFILNSLLSEYDPFQMSYNTMKDKCNMHELHSMLIQEETRLNQGSHSVHYVSHKANQGSGKKLVKKHDKDKWLRSMTTLCKSRRRYQREIITTSVGKSGHFQKDYPKHKS